MKKRIRIYLLLIPLLLLSAGVQAQMAAGTLRSEDVAHDALYYSPFVDRVVAVRWRQFRVYPVEFHMSNTNPLLGGYMGTMHETAGFPRIFNIEADPREIKDVAATGSGWVMGVYAKLIGEYKATLKDHPNPPAPNMTRF